MDVRARLLHTVVIVLGETMEQTFLTQDERARLIAIARENLESYIGLGKKKKFTETSEGMLTQCGAFVTLKIAERLRGCIGNFTSDKPVYQLVADLAIESATRDPRFPAVTKQELPKLKIEISVLSPLQRVAKIEELVVGTHGIYLKKGMYRGVLLPQVATEYGWDRETFLTHTCYKAHLDGDAWKDPKVEIYSFTADIFGD